MNIKNSFGILRQNLLKTHLARIAETTHKLTKIKEFKVTSYTENSKMLDIEQDSKK